MTAPEHFAEKSDSLLHRGRRPYMTHNVILPPSNDAMQKSQLSSLTRQEHGRTVPLSDMQRTSTVKS